MRTRSQLLYAAWCTMAGLMLFLFYEGDLWHLSTLESAALLLVLVEAAGFVGGRGKGEQGRRIGCL